MSGVDGKPETWSVQARSYELLRLRAANLAAAYTEAGMMTRAVWWQNMAWHWRERRDKEQRLADERSKR